jgi:hypothetical protein
MGARTLNVAWGNHSPLQEKSAEPRVGISDHQKLVDLSVSLDHHEFEIRKNKL